jgi:hypothetical protein
MWKPVLTLLIVAGIIAGAINSRGNDPLGNAITLHMKNRHAGVRGKAENVKGVKGVKAVADEQAESEHRSKL